jgi:hypothetical protein
MPARIRTLVIAAAAIASGAAFAQGPADRASRAANPQPTARQGQYDWHSRGQAPADTPYAKIRGATSQGFAPIDTDVLRNRSGQP